MHIKRCNSAYNKGLIYKFNYGIENI